MDVEQTTDPNFRRDIREPLPDDVQWFATEIENGDLPNLFIISSSDWTDISGGSFRVVDVASCVDLPTKNADTKRIGDNIRKKLAFLDSGGRLDTGLIAVTDSLDLTGRFTLIEGNRRSVSFTLRESLVGCMIYTGVSPSISNYKWARKTYRN